MSDSRLEKFIYAICSMDVSDLPVPLSRIEKLWNCLITGETPDFEPLSRNEKYLMAMLDRYDISNLPAPMSRGEKLLYKIAVGETDLSDVPDYLSRYEELLKYLIENGGISGGDFEYVLYTLNQSLSTLYLTAEKPVKCAILSGNTLVNLMTNCKDEYVVRYHAANNPNNNVANISMMKPNTEYTLFYKAKYRTAGDGSGTGGSLKIATSIEQGFINTTQSLTTEYKQYIYRFTTSSVVDCFVFSTTDKFFAIKECVLLEGDYTQEDIPFFEGMQSVQMPVLTTTGKNLFNTIKKNGYHNATNGNWVSDGNYKSISARVLPNTIYTQNIERNNITFWKDGVFVSGKTNSKTFTTPSNCNEVRVSCLKNFETFMLEMGEVATSYEPYKSNILTVNEEVELRGVGDVHDELNLLTGEVTERTDEITLDVTNVSVYTNDTSDRFEITSRTLPKNNQYITEDYSGINNWGLTVTNNYNYGMKNTISYHANAYKFYIRFESGLYTAESLKQKLIETPLTLVYQLETPTIKTVDLTVVDQDNQPTQLGTFENVTHVSLEAENLIPEVEMEVATKISEELASASPLMDDISTEQQQLIETVNEQSNNVDATMIATTEIFEETL